MGNRIPPRAPICPTLVRVWLHELQKRPLEEWEVGGARDPASRSEGESVGDITCM